MRLTPTAVAAASLLIIFASSGCKSSWLEPSGTVTYASSTDTTSAVIVSVEKSYAGDLKGADKDALLMREALSKVTDDIVMIGSSNGSKANVAQAMQRACSNELAVIYFSAHAGQERAKDGKASEADGKDEYIALPSSPLTDNEIWEIISKSTNRVFMIFDCCNSETLFSAPQQAQSKTFSQRKPFSMLASSQEPRPEVRLLCWSASRDGESAYGDPSGGFFTRGIYNAVVKADMYDYDYATLWTIIKYGSVMKHSSPQKTTLGKSFEDKKVFR